MKQLKGSYIVETYDTKTNAIVHTMIVKNGEYVQSDYDTMVEILESEPGKYKRNIWVDYSDCARSYSAPERSKNNE